MNFYFSDIIVFAAFIVALLSYIDRKKSNPPQVDGLTGYFLFSYT